jgi:predicted secreted protein
MTNRTLKTVVSDLDQIHAARLSADKTAKDLASTEAALKQELINFMVEQQVASIGSETYMFSVKEKTRVQVLDWPQVYEYIRQTGEWDLMYKRLNEAAALARESQLPGTEQYSLNELSIRSRK